MKKTVFALALLVSLCLNAFSQQTQTRESVQPEAGIAFDKVEHDFGNIAFASDGTFVFTFTNKTKDAIVLSNVSASCGCTTPQWTKEPVKPGESGEVRVKYNTNAVGQFNKTVMVYSSAQPSPVVLRIKGNVMPREAQEPIQQ
jgi:hypothetical protein